MRWTIKPKAEEDRGNVRVVRKFLFWPRLLPMPDPKYKQWRWLCFARILQQRRWIFASPRIITPPPPNPRHLGQVQVWVNERWV